MITYCIVVYNYNIITVYYLFLIIHSIIQSSTSNCLRIKGLNLCFTNCGSQPTANNKDQSPEPTFGKCKKLIFKIFDIKICKLSIILLICLIDKLSKIVCLYFFLICYVFCSAIFFFTMILLEKKTTVLVW